LGTLIASPSLPFLKQLLNASCLSSFLLSSWLPWIYSPFSIIHGLCNGDLLQLIECIESTRNEVKRKMIETSACSVARKSPEGEAEEKICACSPRLIHRRSFFWTTNSISRDDLGGREASRILPGAKSFWRALEALRSLAIYNEGRF